MTNKTISALSSASTIIGTEVLPIVQSSATVKVSVANLTSGLGTIIATKGGTGQTSYSVGDIIYSDTITTLAKLGIGAANYVLTSSGTVPQYVAQSTLSVGSATNATNTAITDNTSSSATWYPTIVSATTGNLPQTTSSTKLSFVPSTGVLSANGVALTGNLGTVTSVAALTLGTSGTDLSSTVATGTTTPVITLNVPTASATNRGALSAADWTTFNNKGSGTVTSVSATSPVTSTGGTTPTIAMPAATTSVSGYLTSTDWNTFNNKQPSGTYVNSVSGTATRITSTGGVTPVIDLASGVATAGTTGSSTLIPVVTIDTYGRVTGITTASNPQGTVTSVTGTAPVVSSGGTAPAISMAAATTSVNGYLTSTDWTTFNSKQTALVSGTNIKTVGGASLLGSGDVGTIGVAYGGTGLTSLTAGYIPYGNGTSALSSGVGLTFDGTNLKLGTSNGGVIFNNSSALTNSTLNDYEVGTFTPVLAFGGGSTGIVYTNRSGNYTKVGNKVTVSIGIYLSSKGSSTGNATITGLPFTSLNAAFIASSGLIVGSINFLSTTFPLYGVVGGAATSISLQSSVNGNTNLTDTNFSNAMYFSISLTYLASF